jgi:hypothetical protein
MPAAQPRNRRGDAILAGALVLLLAAAAFGEHLLRDKLPWFRNPEAPNAYLADGRLGELLKSMNRIEVTTSARQPVGDVPADGVALTLRDQGRRGRLAFRAADPAGPPSLRMAPAAIVHSHPVVVSISHDSGGPPLVAAAAFGTHGPTAENPATVTLFRDGRPLWSQGCGLRLHGNRWADGYPLEWRVVFRLPYGLNRAPLSALFPGEQGAFKRFTLLDPSRALDMHLGYQLYRAAGVEAPPSLPVRLVLNGRDHGPMLLVLGADAAAARELLGTEDVEVFDQDAPAAERAQLPADLLALERLAYDQTTPLDPADVLARLDGAALARWALVTSIWRPLRPWEGRFHRPLGRTDVPWRWMVWNPMAGALDPPHEGDLPWQAILASSEFKCVLFARLMEEMPEFPALVANAWTPVLVDGLDVLALRAMTRQWAADWTAAGLPIGEPRADAINTVLQARRRLIVEWIARMSPAEPGGGGESEITP